MDLVVQTFTKDSKIDVWIVICGVFNLLVVENLEFAPFAGSMYILVTLLFDKGQSKKPYFKEIVSQKISLHLLLSHHFI